MNNEKEAVSRSAVDVGETVAMPQETNDVSVLPEQDVEKASSAEQEKTTPPPPLDWDNEQDPDNPFNWPKWKRVYNTVVPGLLGFAVYVLLIDDHNVHADREVQHIRQFCLHAKLS
jgi:hypothetical protein